MLTTDDQVRQRVHDRLLGLASKMFLRLQVTVEQGEVTLTGTVVSDYERKVVLQCVREVEGVRRIRDWIRERPLGSARKPASPWPRRLAVAAAMVLLVIVVRSWPRRGETGKTIPVVNVSAEAMAAGQPAVGAFLTMHPLGGPIPELRPQGRVGANGVVEWTTFERGDGLPPGEYRVTAVWHREVSKGRERRPGPNILPPDYSRPETSPLRVVVTPEGLPVRLQLQLAEAPGMQRR